LLGAFSSIVKLAVIYLDIVFTKVVHIFFLKLEKIRLVHQFTYFESDYNP